MKPTALKIGGRTFDLVFNLNAMCDMQDAIPDFDLGKLADYVKTPHGILSMIAIMAKQGELMAGRKLDVDREWFGLHLSPSPKRMSDIQVAILNALAEGMRMETDDGSQESETDVVLEELKKKETKAE